MSAATRAAIQAAIQAHVSERCREGEDLAVTEWFVACTSIRMSTDDDLTTYLQIKSKMPPHHALGLLTRSVVLALRDTVDP